MHGPSTFTYLTCMKKGNNAENKYEIDNKFQQHQHQHGNPVPVGMEESSPHKQSILRNKEVPKENAPHKPRDVTRPTVMVKRYGFRGTLSIKYKIDFWNNPITASVLVWNQVVLNQSQQLGYLNPKLMLSWDCSENGTNYKFTIQLERKISDIPFVMPVRLWAYRVV